MRDALRKLLGPMGLLIVAVVSINVIASRFDARIDVTQDRIFSLSEGSRAILAKLDRDVVARLYFSRSLADLPVQMKTYATRVEEVLREYGNHAAGRLTVEVIDPQPDTEAEESARRYGITPVTLPRGDQAYFGIILTAGAKEVVVPYLDPRREESLEYDLSDAIVSLLRTSKPKVAILSPLPVMGTGMPFGGDDSGRWALVSELERSFEVQVVAADAKSIPSDVKVLVLIHPKKLTEQTLYAVDQFVLAGGRIVAALDPMSRTDLQTNGAMWQMSGQMPDVSSDLPKLLSAWGVEYAPDQLVGDLARAAQINAGGSVLAYPMFMQVGEDGFAKSSPITGSLRQVIYAEGGSFAKADGSKFEFEPLMSTTADSGSVAAQMASIAGPQGIVGQFKSDGKVRHLAVIVRGKFETAFPAGRPKAEDGGENQDAKPHVAVATEEGAVFLLGDADMLADQNAVDRIRFFNQEIVQMRNDNLGILLNAVDVLGGSSELIGIRSKGRIARPFTKVQKLQKEAQLKYQAEEEKLTAELTSLQKRLNDLQAQRTDGNRLVLSDAQQDELRRFRDQEANVKRKRREVRKSLREDIESLGRTLIAANMLVVPALATGVGAAVFTARARRRKEYGHGRD